MLSHQCAGAAPDEPQTVLATADVLVERFRAHLLPERGLKPNLGAFSVASVRPFVSMVVAGDAVDAAHPVARRLRQAGRAR